MAGTKINEATLRETLQGTESIPIVDTDLPKGRVTAEKLKEYVQPDLSGYAKKTEIPAAITVDTELNPESTNPVQNKVITEKVNSMQEDLNLLLGAGYGMWYGVEWDITQAASALTRIGNMDLHKSLPIQSGMYRCVLNDNGEEVYKLDPDDSTKKEDGVTAAVLDGTDGMVMVRIPAFYAKFVTDGDKRRVLLSEYALPGFRKMGGSYISAYEATIDRTASGTPKMASVVNTTANFRGGNNNAERDGTPQTQLGMPATSTSLTNFRTYARNRKAGSVEWNCYDYNRLDNLRKITNRENVARSKVSPYGRGVRYFKRINRFGAEIGINNTRYYLGTFQTEEEACNAYKKALSNWEDKGVLPLKKDRSVKLCKRCGMILPKSEFYYVKGHGTTYLCKECHKKEMKKIRDTNRQLNRSEYEIKLN